MDCFERFFYIESPIGLRYANAMNFEKVKFYLLDANKNVIQTTDFSLWLEWCSDVENRCLKHSVVEKVQVSTVFLGIDYAQPKPLGDNTPVLFETLIIGGERDGEMWRWTTAHEALLGHEEIATELSKETQFN